VYHPGMFILASASPRRRDLLLAAGFQFEVVVADVDETPRDGEAPEGYARRVAMEKAAAVSAIRPDRWVLGADTVVVLDGEIFGKPSDDHDAARMLQRLSGRAHDVLTAVALTGPGGTQQACGRTRVWMQALAPGDIAAYVASGEPRGKAGAYAIQGLASRFIPRIDGEYSNVVGLPVHLVARLLIGAAVVS
jgi:septum formation protein